jgi:glycosyltransferase involved in cell wall biosynthesis
MEIGGSQINAIQIAGAIRDRGHDVLMVSEPGPMVEAVRRLHIEHLEIPMQHGALSLAVIAKLCRLVRRRGIDLIHGYELMPVLAAYFGPHLRYGVPVVGTIMSMSVVWFFPRNVPLIVGTEEIQQDAITAGHRRVTLMEPPVDTESDNPALIDGIEFRTRHGVQEDEVLVVIVSRLVSALKAEGLRMTCEAVGRLAARYPVKLVIVGGGPMHDELAARAMEVNACNGRRVIVLAGEMMDPRTAYAAADIVVGMGGSALRGLAFGKPLIVVGEEGFSELLTPSSLSTFLRQGWYGKGPGSMGAGMAGMVGALQRLLDKPELRTELGSSSRRLVVERFSIQHAAELQEKEYVAALENRIETRLFVKDCVRTAAGLSARSLRQTYRTLCGERLMLAARPKGAPT